MDFVLKTLGLDEAAALPAQALVVLAGDDFRPGNDALTTLIERARTKGDFKTEAGTLLTSYGAPDVLAERVLLLGIGDGAPARVRKAIGAAAGFLKSARFTAVTFCFAQDTTGAALEAAVLAIRDALYLYTATKTAHSKAEPSQITHVTFGVPEVKGQTPQTLRAAFARANAVGEGIALAREWANRPANHATPALLAQVAQALT
ncbi:MAG: leucyl aminopeptidase, partial [Burkholderiaceae bacterium]|nr:leucyl aminopeptidase [Burkholderiaceae bacterium]